MLYSNFGYDPVRGRAIAMLASCFGRGQSLRRAGLLTLAGEDPRGVMADTTVAFANGTLGLRIGFVPSGQVSGMSVLSPPR